ncbi:hypothetical protein BN946_scf184876.g17 [Trametes cinnabarina]|uniref:Peptidase S53 domain-containing protein n=1 Tax=Pycnoporus cinnabarinus TaxID=5643 RepID=A0A060SV74_PYCCI|nr:hypothetical protein BN946_scf184876.g17 [Trametes cinnabarina]
MLLTGFFTLGVASLALAARTPVRRVVHESRRSLPTGWTPVRRAELDLVVPLSIGLVQSNLENLEAYLLDVSHPDSPNYGQHWTPAQVADAFRPSQASVDAVRSWLVKEGQIDADRITVSKSGSWILANVTVREAEELLGTEYYVYQHGQDGKEHLACHQAYHVPKHVSKHVDLITPTLHFDTKITRHAITAPLDSAKDIGKVSRPVTGNVIHSIFNDLEQCDEVITLACLRVLYDFAYVPVAINKNTIGVVEYTPQSHNASDFDAFFANFSRTQVGERPKLVSIDGGVLVPSTDPNAYAESSLDLQYVLGLIGTKRQEVQLYQVGDPVEGASFNNLLDGLDQSYCTSGGGDDPTQDGIYPDPQPGGYGKDDCGIVRPAYIISTSYGYQEADLTPAYMQRQCAEYGKLSLTGVTFVYSSGDAGVGGRQDVVPGHKVTQPESAVFQRFPSGGGFSNVFPRPAFQEKAVSTYLTKYPPGYAPNIYNASGRAFPDVSANGLNYSVAINGQFRLVSGTSASAPTFASILSAVNDARLALGKKPVGWINPAIYSEAFNGAFNDITNGSNPNCGTQGFLAKPGWDPVTGLGTPNFPKMLAKWLLLP